MVHAFNPSLQEAEAEGSLSSRQVWSAKRVTGQPGLPSLEKKRCVCMYAYAHIKYDRDFVSKYVLDSFVS